MRSLPSICLVAIALMSGAPLMAQAPAAPASPEQAGSAVDQADPTAAIQQPVLESSVHQTLPEQYILLAAPPGVPTRNDATPRYFRASFSLEKIPSDATLYLASPGHVRTFINGQPVAEASPVKDAKTSPLVVIAPVAQALRRGRNVVAIEVQGYSTIAAKIIPAQEGVVETAVFISGLGGKTTLNAAAGWESPGFDDSSWQSVKALGSVETLVHVNPRDPQTTNLEWNSDSEMYRWPGYDGISSYLAHLPIVASTVSDAVEAGAHFENINALTQSKASTEFTVQLPAEKLDDSAQQAPSLVLDFGRETNGRLEVTSDSDQPIRLTLQYGESKEEAIKSPYLGTNLLRIPPHATGYGPKSAFRYVKLSFPPNANNVPVRIKSIRVDATYYPVQYRGSFESSDPMLNRIWAVGAYTAHLCMQDAIWDAPKRDRGPWMGDLDVSGHVIDTVFADHFLMQATMDRLISDAGQPVRRDVNGIPGYSAFWVMGEADYYRHTADQKYLRSIREPLVSLLDYMTTELDSQNVFVNAGKAWPFVDWSPEFDKDTSQARRATQFEFYRAFSEGAWLLGEIGDSAGAERFRARAEAIRKAAQSTALDASTDTFGDRWQANAMAVYSGVADAKQTSAIWQRVLSRPPKFMITPYYNFYAISAMADAGHRREALDWIRKYWGGMIDEGATSFWEGYDPSWPKKDFHAHLQADDGEGYFVSLAHGWSSGPTVWLSEQILGIRPTEPGFREASIRPDLAGLQWARGAVPTPSGLISVDYKTTGTALEAQIDLPSGVKARVSMPVCAGENSIDVNGKRTTGELAESGTRTIVAIGQAGHSTLRSSCGGLSDR